MSLIEIPFNDIELKEMQSVCSTLQCECDYIFRGQILSFRITTTNSL